MLADAPAAPAATPIGVLTARGLSYRYEVDESLPPVLDEVSLNLSAGEFAILTGPSGSGKTTLLTLIGALRRHQQGHLAVLGRNLAEASDAAMTELRRNIGFVFQEHNLFDAFTPRETLQLAMKLRTPRYRPEEFAGL